MMRMHDAGFTAGKRGVAAAASRRLFGCATPGLLGLTSWLLQRGGRGGRRAAQGDRESPTTTQLGARSGGKNRSHSQQRRSGA